MTDVILSKKQSTSQVTAKATHRGKLVIGDISIPCAVLESGERVLSENGVTRVLGSTGGKNERLRAKRTDGHKTPMFIASKALQPFIIKSFTDADLSPIKYIDGARVVYGFPASILPKVCEAWLKARDAGALQAQQYPKAMRAEMLMRGLSHIGVLALVDEATGYQRQRGEDELEKILNKWLTGYAKKWAKTFPDEFWDKLLMAKGYESYIGLKRPQFIGHWVNNIVYSRLAPGVLHKIKQQNPKTKSGTRKFKHFQFLTDHHGAPELREHLVRVMTIMDISIMTGQDFDGLIDSILPRYGKTIGMDLQT